MANDTNACKKLGRMVEDLPEMCARTEKLRKLKNSMLPGTAKKG